MLLYPKLSKFFIIQNQEIRNSIESWKFQTFLKSTELVKKYLEYFIFHINNF